MIRRNFDDDIKQALPNYGVEMNDTSMTGNTLREAFWMKHWFERYTEYHEDQIKHFIYDDAFCEKYFTKAREMVNDLIKDEDKFYAWINREIQGHFEDKVKEKFTVMSEKGDEANRIAKRWMFIWLKKKLFETWVLSFSTERVFRDAKRLKHMP